MEERKELTFIGRLSLIGNDYLGIRIKQDFADKNNLKTHTTVRVILEILEEPQ